MSDLHRLLELSDQLDQKGLESEADLLDSCIVNFSKTAKINLHKCGLKEESVDNHLELYKGYEKAVSHYESEYKKLFQSNNEVESPNYGKLRDLTVNYPASKNSVLLHDLYLADVINNNPYPIEKDKQMHDILKSLFGDYNKFVHELTRLAQVSRNGWVLLCYCTEDKKLHFNVIDLHEEHLIACYVPVLALDMWEHAYVNDFGVNKEAYVEWFLNRIDWRNPRKRLKNLMRLK